MTVDAARPDARSSAVDTTTIAAENQRSDE